MADKAPKKETYVLRRGNHELVEVDEDGNTTRKLIQAGEKAELTEGQARAFADKFVSQKVYQAEQKHLAELAKEGDMSNATHANVDESNELNPRASPTPNQAGNADTSTVKPGVSTPAVVDKPIMKPAPLAAEGPAATGKAPEPAPTGTAKETSTSGSSSTGSSGSSGTSSSDKK